MGGPGEDLDADGAFFQQIGSAQGSVLHHEAQKFLAAFAGSEDRAGQNGLQVGEHQLGGAGRGRTRIGLLGFLVWPCHRQ